jgi:E3 ubiquitin-protein ligase HUWE1
LNGDLETANFVCSTSTKIAIKMGRATDKGRDPNKAEDDAASSAFSADEEEQEEVEREETPDLYRNSALGM